MSPWIFPEHLLAVLSPNAKGCSRRKDCPGSGKKLSLAPAATGQAGHCQPLGAHCPALSLAGCGGGEGESRGGDTRLCSPSGSAAEGLTLLGSQTTVAAGWERMVAACLLSGPLELTESSLACLRHPQQRFWFLWVIVLINVGVVGVVGVLGVVRPAPSPAWKSVISSFHHLRCWS